MKREGGDEEKEEEEERGVLVETRGRRQRTRRSIYASTCGATNCRIDPG